MIASLRRWWKDHRHQAAMRRMDRLLDEPTVEAIVAAVGGYIANRTVRYCTEADLPYPREAIEMAFIKAITQWPAGDSRMESLKGVYIILDDFLLTADEARVLNQHHAFITRKDHADRSPKELLAAYNETGGPEAVRISDALMDKMRRRSEALKKMWDAR